MKRALIVLLLLAIAAGGLFAEINVSGNATTGLAVFIEDGGPYFTLFTHPEWNNGPRYTASASLSGTNSSGKAGGSISAGRTSAGQANGGGEVWFIPVDGLRVRAGNIGIWWHANPPGYLDGNNQVDVGFGVFLESDGFEKAGLNWGVGIYPDRDGFGAVGGFADTRYTGYVKYKADLFTVGANATYNGGHWSPIPGNKAIDAAVGASTNVAGIGIAVNAVANNVQDLTGSGSLAVGPVFDFGFGDLSASLGAELYIPVAGQKFGVAAGVGIGYPITGAINLGVDALFSLNHALGDVTVPYDYRAGSQLPTGYNEGGTTHSLNVNPMLKIATSYGGEMRIGYNFMTNIGGESKMHNALYTAYRITF